VWVTVTAGVKKTWKKVLNCRRISASLDKVYEGTRPAVLKRFGETDDRSDEMI